MAFLNGGGCTKNNSHTDETTAKQGAASSMAATGRDMPSAATATPNDSAGKPPATGSAEKSVAEMANAKGQTAGEVVSEWQPRGDWSMQRLIVLGEQGPWVVDLAVSIGGKSLEQASLEQLTQLADELLAELKSPAEWKDLLQLPLVSSGWLGNLVPTEQQLPQLISLYDTERDDLVSREELPPFLSRGLARMAPLQTADIGFASDQDPSRSPWGPADRNRDFSLDGEEQAEFAATVAVQDLDTNGVITRGELAGAADSAASGRMSSGRSSLLQANTLLVTESWLATQPESQADPRDTSVSDAHLSHLQAESAQTRKLASDLLRHYTFLSALSREQWPDWSEKRWLSVDGDADGQIDRAELQQWLTGPPQVQLYVTLPSSSSGTVEHEHDRPSVQVQKHDPAVAWQQSEGGGQLICGNCAVRVQVNDVFNKPQQVRLRQQLQRALSDPQLRSFLQPQLVLNATAFDLIDQDKDATLSDSEFEQVWRWLSSRSSGRVAGRWMLSSYPWFQLADLSADERVAEWELQSFADKLPRLDRNGDSLLTPDELPLVSTLSLTRSDPRLEQGLAARETARAPVTEDDWFSAMDANGDAVVSPSEFLGDKRQFTSADSDQDGFLSRGEVSIPKASK